MWACTSCAIITEPAASIVNSTHILCLSIWVPEQKWKSVVGFD